MGNNTPQRKKPLVYIARSLPKNENVAGLAFIAPLFIIFMVFTGVPIISTMFYLAFTEYNIMTTPTWVGLDNFRRMFDDPAMPSMLWNTFRFPLMLVPVHVGLGFILAYIVYSVKNPILKYVGTTSLYYPVILTTASVAMAWGYLFNRDFGVINWALKSIGLIDTGIAWTTSSNFAMWAIVIFSGWKFVGIYFMYYLVGLLNIPHGYYEAAQIDGANSIQICWNITIPLLTPTIFYVFVVVTIGAMQAFDEPFFLTEGGPGFSTTTASLFIYKKAFNSYAMGYASSVAAVLLILIFAITAVQMKLQSRWVNYDYE